MRALLFCLFSLFLSRTKMVIFVSFLENTFYFSRPEEKSKEREEKREFRWWRVLRLWAVSISPIETANGVVWWIDDVICDDGWICRMSPLSLMNSRLYVDWISRGNVEIDNESLRITIWVSLFLRGGNIRGIVTTTTAGEAFSVWAS